MVDQARGAEDDRLGPFVTEGAREEPGRLEIALGLVQAQPLQREVRSAAQGEELLLLVAPALRHLPRRSQLARGAFEIRRVPEKEAGGAERVCFDRAVAEPARVLE